MEDRFRVGVWLDSQRCRLYRDAASTEEAEAFCADLGLEAQGWVEGDGFRTLLARFPEGMPDRERMGTLSRI